MAVQRRRRLRVAVFLVGTLLPFFVCQSKAELRVICHSTLNNSRICDTLRQEYDSCPRFTDINASLDDVNYTIFNTYRNQPSLSIDFGARIRYLNEESLSFRDGIGSNATYIIAYTCSSDPAVECYIRRNFPNSGEEEIFSGTGNLSYGDQCTFYGCFIYCDERESEEKEVYGILPDVNHTILASCSGNLGSDVENGNVTYSQPLLERQERYVEYTTATVSCSEGYTGGGIITCQTNGNWSSPTLPNCEIVDCSDPPTLINGDYERPANTTYGASVTYVCNEDYVFSEVSSQNRTCHANGSWSDEDIECLPTCLGSNVENGRVTYSEEPFEKERYFQNTTATVSCSEGYTGGGVIICQTNGNWSSPTLPSCEIVDCSDPPALINGDYERPANTTYGASVTYVCNEDYVFSEVSSQNRTCHANGSWSDEDIECLQRHKTLECKDRKECLIERILPSVSITLLIAVLCTVLLLCWRKYQHDRNDKLKQYRYLFGCHVQREQLDPHYTPVDVQPHMRISISLSLTTALDTPTYMSPLHTPLSKAADTKLPVHELESVAELEEQTDAVFPSKLDKPMHESATELPNQTDTILPSKLEENTTGRSLEKPSEYVSADLVSMPINESDHVDILFDFNGLSCPSSPSVDSPESLNVGRSENAETQPFELVSESSDQFATENTATAASSPVASNKGELPSDRHNDFISDESDLEESRSLQSFDYPAETSKPSALYINDHPGCNPDGNISFLPGISSLKSPPEVSFSFDSATDDIEPELPVLPITIEGNSNIQTCEHQLKVEANEGHSSLQTSPVILLGPDTTAANSTSSSGYISSLSSHYYECESDIQSVATESLTNTGNAIAMLTVCDSPAPAVMAKEPRFDPSTTLEPFQDATDERDATCSETDYIPLHAYTYSGSCFNGYSNENTSGSSGYVSEESVKNRYIHPQNNELLPHQLSHGVTYMEDMSV